MKIEINDWQAEILTGIIGQGLDEDFEYYQPLESLYMELIKDEERQAKKSKCSECGEVINWDAGGFVWEGLAFCEFHDPERKEK